MKRTNKESKHSNDIYWIEYGIDLDARNIMLDEEVDEVSMGWILRAIDKMMEKDETKDINLVINSYGGCVYDGLALYDTLRLLPVNVNTFATGKVMSMGLIIYLGGDKRVASKNVTFLAHSISSGVWGKLFEMETEVNECKRLNNILLDILEERTNTKWRRKIKYKDFLFDFDNARKLGVINV